jgi:hypothetical protein
MLTREYDLDPYSLEALELVAELQRTIAPFLGPDCYPDMAHAGERFLVYEMAPDVPFARVARGLEGRVLHDEWGISPGELADSRLGIEDCTTWFLLLSLAERDAPIPVGAMSVADCLGGKSETLRAAHRLSVRHGLEVPEALTVRPADIVGGLWDVMQISLLREHRRTNASPWLYHALYRSSLDAGVCRWVANMTRREFDLLTALAIPFVEVDGIRGTDWDAPDDLDFGFQTIDVNAISPSMSKLIDALVSAHREDPNSGWLKLANVASVALRGCRVDEPIFLSKVHEES